MPRDGRRKDNVSKKVRKKLSKLGGFGRAASLSKKKIAAIGKRGGGKQQGKTKLSEVGLLAKELGISRQAAWWKLRKAKKA